MKVCYISPYKSSSGYGVAAREYILSLDNAAVNVVPRFVQMTDKSAEVDNRILELEKQDLDNVDVVIQHNLPNELVYKGGVRNIGAFAYETNGLPSNSWKHNLEVMDDIIVFCQQQRQVILKEIPNYDPSRIHVVPHSIDISKLDRKLEPINFGLPKEVIKFYTIAEFNRRKNFPALISAYLSRFTADDNVVLIIKTGGVKDNIKQMIDEIKGGSNRFDDDNRYAKIILINDHLSDEDMCRLHQSCDVFVTASHGESWCLPAVDALGFGNPIIAPAYGAFEDYMVNKYIGIPVGGTESPIFGMVNVPKGLYTSEENWFNISINSLANAMEIIALDKEYYRSKINEEKRINFVKENFSRKQVGLELKEILNAN
jgi:glycosyltransferase involved in cell wall biosynthesis